MGIAMPDATLMLFFGPDEFQEIELTKKKASDPWVVAADAGEPLSKGTVGGHLIAGPDESGWVRAKKKGKTWVLIASKDQDGGDIPAASEDDVKQAPRPKISGGTPKPTKSLKCFGHALSYLAHDNIADKTQEDLSRLEHACSLHPKKAKGCNRIVELRRKFVHSQEQADISMEAFAECVEARKAGKVKKKSEVDKLVEKIQEEAEKEAKPRRTKQKKTEVVF
jgi:hypothetical protein